MRKTKVGIIMGGMSTEHDISLVSGTSVINHLDKEKYDIFPIYIEKDGEWYKYIKPIDEIKAIKVGETIKEIEKIENIFEYLKEMDVVLPILHGLYGEDGTIQGFLDLINVKYVGCDVISSSISMDKVYTKALLKTANIPQAKYIYLKNYNGKYIYVDEEFNDVKMDINDICDIIEGKLNYPVFVKPSNSGSSVGINKSKNKQELIEHIKYAEKFDRKIVIEESIEGREIECAILEDKDEVKASEVGEIIPAEDFYSFDAKYKSAKSKTIIPANIENEDKEKIKKLAIKVFKTVDGKGLARVDFFIKKSTNEIIVNEINTMPGFTSISMYPMLWQQCGIEYGKLLDILIENRLEK